MLKVVQYKRLHKVRVGDDILGYGKVTAINVSGTLHTDTGYTCLSFPAGKSVPVIRVDMAIFDR